MVDCLVVVVVVVVLFTCLLFLVTVLWEILSRRRNYVGLSTGVAARAKAFAMNLSIAFMPYNF